MQGQITKNHKYFCLYDIEYRKASNLSNPVVSKSIYKKLQFGVGSTVTKDVEFGIQRTSSHPLHGVQ